MMKIFLSLLFMLTATSAIAQSVDPKDDSLAKIGVVYSQQETGITAVDILAPNMGRWGRLGLNLGAGNYYQLDAEGKNRLLDTNQFSLVWSNEETLLNIDNAMANRTLALNSALRFGLTSYEFLEDVQVKTSTFTYIEMEFLYSVTSSLKNNPASWAKRSSLGIGAGFRVNFNSKQEFIGTTEVDNFRVYPTLQATFSLF